MAAFRERIFDTDAWLGTAWFGAGGAAAGGGLVPRRSDPPASPASGERSAKLARVVETQVIPRLVRAHLSHVHPARDDVADLRRGAGSPARADRGCTEDLGRITAEDVREFTGLVLAPDVDLALAYVAVRRARGAARDALYLDLLAPAARLLGQMWEEDSAGFLEVTMGLVRLHEVMHEIGSDAPDARAGARGPEAAAGGRARRALLLPAPGDDHTFGAAMVADFFRRAGWTVWTAPGASGDTSRKLAGVVRRGWFDLVGFSVGGTGRLDALAESIRALRRASRNPGVVVMVGGPLFVAHPELAAHVGADGTALDGRQAVLHAESLLALSPERVR